MIHNHLSLQLQEVQHLWTGMPTRTRTYSHIRMIKNNMSENNKKPGGRGTCL